MIPLQEVARDIKQLCDENPDRTNNGECRYVLRQDDPGQKIEFVPNCIVGTYLNRFCDISTSTLHDWDDRGDSSICTILWAVRLPVEFSQEAIEFLSDAQGYADHCGDGDMPWSLVLDELKSDRRFHEVLS